jgi:hypothetical protein
MKLKQLVSAGLAAAALFAGSASMPISSAEAAAVHGDWKKQTVWFDEWFTEIGRTIHYCDGHFELIGTSVGAVYSDVIYGPFGSCA